MPGWCLRAGDELVGFGQYYDRYHRINLARIVVHPELRGEGLGKRLLAALMQRAGMDLDLAEYSLFVYRDNDAAIRCYSALGFRRTDFPRDAPMQDVTYYMTCSRQYNTGRS